ncbi:hypothetical protein [Anatilimnocola floriformis]|uniref:hypothetical protein n=1 Tax=Anatilimnocola floriformis TaxID=2948575 RepID=UPI0020C3649E|nr:hypothetical protein [Anatilimnocola floriformis]
MAHFVHIPAPKNPGDAGISELVLPAANGTCAIGVWGMPDDSTVAAENNFSFVAAEFRNQNQVRSFYLRGLKAGDKIAAFLPSGGQFTSWLPVKFVKGDKHATERAAGKLPRSKHKPNFILDPHGAEQRHPPVKESAWLDAVEANLAKIKANPLGAAVLGGIVRDITITPFISSEQNANSAVTFTPQQWNGAGAGDRADEVLLHELIHVLENNFGGYKDNPADGLQWDDSDFLTVTVSNMYSSLVGRPLRKDHQGFGRMPDGYRLMPSLFKTAQATNFTSVKNRLPAYSRIFAGSSAPWNPFK